MEFFKHFKTLLTFNKNIAQPVWAFIYFVQLVLNPNVKNLSLSMITSKKKKEFFIK
jgi:hypothetical protein